jgi:hypothetical protein
LQQGRSRITVDLGSAELYRALRIAAIERDCPMREVIVQAIEQWLDRANGQSAFVARDGEGAAAAEYTLEREQVSFAPAGNLGERVHG